MQLTKDDIKDYNRGEQSFEEKVLDFSKFQQVVEFYGKYKDKPDLFEKEQKLLYDIWYKQYCYWIQKQQPYNAIRLKDWLFSYCFKDGLK